MDLNLPLISLFIDKLPYVFRMECPFYIGNHKSKFFFDVWETFIKTLTIANQQFI